MKRSGTKSLDPEKVQVKKWRGRLDSRDGLLRNGDEKTPYCVDLASTPFCVTAECDSDDRH